MFQLKTDISNLFRVSITLVFFTAFFLGAVVDGFGQEKRRYATRQEFRGQALLGLLLPGTIQNANNAVDGNTHTNSTLSVNLGALNQMLATQFLDFEGRLPKDTPVTIKLELPTSTLGVFNNFTIQPYTNLNKGGGTLIIPDYWRATAAGTGFQGSTLLSVLQGKGTIEITINPTSDFDGIWIQLGSTLGLAANMGVFHAYVMESGPELDCTEKNTPVDVLSGARSDDLSLLTSLNGVSNPYNAINGNLNDHATMTVVVGALNTTYLNTIFPTPSEAGQRVRILLDDPGGLLNLGLLSSFTIQPMLGSSEAGSALGTSGSFLSLRLLPGTTKYELAYTIEEVFDRIELRFENTVTALTSLKVYDVSRAPGIILIDNPSEALNGCGQVDLNNAIANYQPDHYSYNYYTTASGGTPLASSLITTSGNYYIEAVDPVTGCTSPRVMVNVTVIAVPTITLSLETSICIEDNSAMLNYSNVTNGGNQYKITWNEEISGLNNVEYTAFPSSGPIIISGLNSITDGNYNGTLTIRNTSTGCESEPYNFTLKVLPTPGRAQMTIQNTSN